jgi:hypothetical protein
VVWDQADAEGNEEHTVRKLDEEGARNALLEIMLYLIAAARGNVDEAAGYGPLRLLEGAQRIARLLDEAGLADDELRDFANDFTKQAMEITQDPALTRQTADAALQMITGKLDPSGQTAS